MEKEAYLTEVLRETPRLISQLNRNPISENYGCFDRQYWQYTLIDFPCARMQEAVLTLALLYKIKHRDNPYHTKKIICSWVNAALDYWLVMQNKNGSFNEWYPKENSFVAAAFSSYAVSETLIQLENLVDSRDDIISGLIKSGKWISGKKEVRAVNQEAGAAMALYNIHLLTGDDFFEQKSFEKIEFIIDKQAEEGWFNEYGGADIGYLSLAVDYLAKLYTKTGDKRLLNLLSNAVGFIKYFIHPDGSAGGLCGSRNTEYLIPDGFELLSGYIPDAALISGSVRKSLGKRSLISPSTLDDRYLMYIGYTFLQAYMDSSELDEGGELPYATEFTRDFSKAGLWVYSDPLVYLIVNYRKGGVYRLSFKGENISLNDAGVLIYGRGGDKLASGWLTDKNRVELRDGKLRIEGVLWRIPDKTLTPMKNILLRTFQLSLGRSENLSQTVKEKLRDMLITKTGSTNHTFIREIDAQGTHVGVTDLIDGVGGGLYINCNTPLVYTPSSRYFLPGELNSLQEGIKLDDKERFKIERIFDKKTGSQLSSKVTQLD
ncbi:MAG: hypothetical protein B6U72_03070 [Candidatus Altiarchaeales archaeon ex4484_2]|nr:MAG: hypothetical protein B6U72_03070 [Candidatus Altiarchaeales archaeon ex4484_2]